jgi:hypothetical protein
MNWEWREGDRMGLHFKKLDIHLDIIEIEMVGLATGGIGTEGTGLPGVIVDNKDVKLNFLIINKKFNTINKVFEINNMFNLNISIRNE